MSARFIAALFFSAALGFALVMAVLAHAEPDYCGHGPVEVTLYEPSIENCNKTICSWGGDPESGYRQSCYQTLMSCEKVRTERWTDYPDCGGTPIRETTEKSE